MYSFSDLDALGHVNHAVFVTYLEQARFHWWAGIFSTGRPFEEEGFLVARVEMDYRKPILLGDAVRVGLRARKIGTSSFTLAYRVVREPGWRDLRGSQRRAGDADSRPGGPSRCGPRPWPGSGGRHEARYRLVAEGAAERRPRGAPSPRESSRLVDLYRVEQVRLAKLGEGRAAALAAETGPADLRRS